MELLRASDSLLQRRGLLVFESGAYMKTGGRP